MSVSGHYLCRRPKGHPGSHQEFFYDKYRGRQECGEPIIEPAVLLRDTPEDRERLVEKLRSEVLPPWWDGPLSDEPMDVADALIAALRGEG